MELQIRFWLFASFLAYAYATVWWGHLWRTWLGWLEYVVGGLLIVGATYWMTQEGLITTWQQYQAALIWNYCAASPVIVLWIFKASLDANRARAQRRENEREYQGLMTDRTYDEETT